MIEDAFLAVRRYLHAFPSLRRGHAATDEQLRELGQLWGPVPVDFMCYLKEFGWVTVGAFELLGLGDDVQHHQNLIERASGLWRGETLYKLPEKLLPIVDSGGEWFYCLSKLHPGQPVVCWSQEYEDLGEEQPYDERYPTWSAWFFEHVVKGRA